MATSAENSKTKKQCSEQILWWTPLLTGPDCRDGFPYLTNLRSVLESLHCKCKISPISHLSFRSYKYLYRPPTAKKNYTKKVPSSPPGPKITHPSSNMQSMPSVYPGACTQDSSEFKRRPKYQTPESPFHFHEILFHDVHSSKSSQVWKYPKPKLLHVVGLVPSNYCKKNGVYRPLKRLSFSFSLQSSQYHFAGTEVNHRFQALEMGKTYHYP
jgi:hypothetical protein